MNLTDLASVKRYMNLATTNSDATLSGLIPSESQTFLDETGRSSFDSQSYSEVRDGHGSDIMQLAYFPVTAVASLQIDSDVMPLSTAWNMRGFQWDALGKISLVGGIFSCGGYFTQGRKNVLVNYTAGYLPIIVPSELQTIPATPGPCVIQVAQPNWRTDSGVVYFIGGGPLAPVLGAPTVGQYFVMGNGGYLFNAADQGKQVQISYTAAGYPGDIVGAVNEMVLLRYKQRDNIDVKSQRLGETTTTFSGADYPNNVKRIMKKYKRYFYVPGF
jgi:hypothetical protein